jgi:thiamine biosynthesis protein ThiS
MKLTINGQVREVAQPQLTVDQLLGELGLSGRPVAVEVNRQLVFKRDHSRTSLREGDQVEVVTMVGGG